MLPVRAGIIPTRSLGACVESYNEDGHSVIGEVGELVLTKPMPSMPIYFWGDTDGKRYLESYFDWYPGIWRHGDWIQINEDGSCILYGRSDSTINRGGVRMGTSEVYKVVETVDSIAESLVIDLEYKDRPSFMALFVVMKKGTTLTKAIETQIVDAIKEHLSPRFVPNEIVAVKAIPKTLNGKKLEVPIRKILLGMDVEKTLNQDAIANPDSLSFFYHYREMLTH